MAELFEVCLRGNKTRVSRVELDKLLNMVGNVSSLSFSVVKP